MRPRTFVVETDEQRTFLSAFVGRQAPPFQIELGDVREARSINQNRRLWALHQLASEHTGYTPEECHEEMLCQHFGSTEVERANPWTGEWEVKRVPLKRSSTREKKEFAAFMEACEIFYGQTLGVWLDAQQE